MTKIDDNFKKIFFDMITALMLDHENKEKELSQFSGSELEKLKIDNINLESQLNNVRSENDELLKGVREKNSELVEARDKIAYLTEQLEKQNRYVSELEEIAIAKLPNADWQKVAENAVTALVVLSQKLQLVPVSEGASNNQNPNQQTIEGV